MRHALSRLGPAIDRVYCGIDVRPEEHRSGCSEVLCGLRRARRAVDRCDAGRIRGWRPVWLVADRARRHAPPPRSHALAPRAGPRAGCRQWHHACRAAGSRCAHVAAVTARRLPHTSFSQ
ncbi:hypothetical protein G6F31_015373 [Rhizopus arrhizus]|nr:hypothetical protein G6F31_015373 [Rhizopus arrhizus]